MEIPAQASRNNALLVRKRARAQRPRPSRARPDQARAAEVTASKAPPGSSATRPRVRSPVPVVAPPPAREHARRWISRPGGSQKRALPAASRPSSLEEPGSGSQCGSAIWRRLFPGLRRGALPPFRTFQRHRGGRGRLYALSQKGGTQDSSSAEFPRGKGFAVTLSGNGWSPEGERTSRGRKPAFFRLFKPWRHSSCPLWFCFFVSAFLGSVLRFFTRRGPRSSMSRFAERRLYFVAFP